MIHDTDKNNKQSAIVVDEIDNQYTFKHDRQVPRDSVGRLKTLRVKGITNAKQDRTTSPKTTKGLTSQQETESRRNE